jgi:hypothetical protein
VVQSCVGGVDGLEALVSERPEMGGLHTSGGNRMPALNVDQHDAQYGTGWEP